MRSLLASLALCALVAPSYAAPPPGGGGGDPTANRISGSENYVPTFGLRASISRNFRVQGVLAVDAGLDIPNERTRKRVDAIRPRIMSSLRDAVLNYASRSYISGERPDVDLLRARMQRAVDAELGKGVASVTLASVIVFKN